VITLIINIIGVMMGLELQQGLTCAYIPFPTKDTTHGRKRVTLARSTGTAPAISLRDNLDTEGVEISNTLL
jgi:hypothetical protein